MHPVHAERERCGQTGAESERERLGWNSGGLGAER
jgi:hypothetical protein